MNNEQLIMNANEVVAFLQKSPKEFTKADIMYFIRENDIEMVNLMYPGGDGKLKTLNFVITDLAYLDTILTCGERVDGSSLFSFIQAGSSDLYVLPRFSTAFVDPFAEIPTLCLLCSYFDKDGNPLESSPEHTLRKASEAFTKVTGMEFQAMGELEYYVISEDEEVFPAIDQRGYHESAPYAKTNGFRQMCMKYIAKTGGQIKYGHSEVGNFKQDGLVYEQNEIEFLPVRVEDAADQLMVAKWVIRNLAYEYGYDVTFAPKITTGKAGSGLHIHMRIVKDGKNQMLSKGVLSEKARKMIAGMMELAPSITAFGNKNPMSYFRLVPHQEAPTNVCWGDRNRSVLVRVPLGWAADVDMCKAANPNEPKTDYDTSIKQTVEMRSPDGSADLYQLLAGPPWRRDERRIEGGREDLRQRQHPRQGQREETRTARTAARQLRGICRLPEETAQGVRGIRRVLTSHDRRHHRPAQGIQRQDTPQGHRKETERNPEASRNLLPLRIVSFSINKKGHAKYLACPFYRL